MSISEYPGKSELTPPPELEKMEGFDISLAGLLSPHYPIGALPTFREIYPKLEYIMGALNDNETRMYLKSDTILAVTNCTQEDKAASVSGKMPFYYMKEFADLNPATESFGLLWKNTQGPVFKFTVDRDSDLSRLKDKLIKKLESDDKQMPVSLLKHSQNQISERYLYKINGLTNSFHVVPLLGEYVSDPDNRSPMLSITYERNNLGVMTLNIALTVSTDDDSASVSEFSPLRNIIGLEINSDLHFPASYGLPRNRENTISWDKNGRAEVEWTNDSDRLSRLRTDNLNSRIINHAESIGLLNPQSPHPLFRLSESSVKALTEPMYIDYGNQKILERNPLEMAVTAAKMIYYASIGETNLEESETGRYVITRSKKRPDETFRSPAIDRATRNNLRESIALSLTESQEGFGTFFTDELFKTAVERDINSDLTEFASFLTKAADANPGRFLRYLFAIGLDRLIPAFADLSDSERITFYELLHKADAPEQWIWNYFKTDNPGQLPYQPGTTREENSEKLYDFALKMRTDPEIINSIANINLKDAENFIESFVFGSRRILNAFKKVKPEYLPEDLSDLEAMTEIFALLPRRENFRIPDNNYPPEAINMIKRCNSIGLQAFKERKEAPFGCVITHEGLIMTESANEVTHKHDITQHAEIIAMKKLKDVYPEQTDFSKFWLWTNVEPCAACGEFARHMNINIGWGANSPNMGSYSRFPILKDRNLLNVGEPFKNMPEIIGGIRDTEVKELFRTTVGWEALFREFDPDSGLDRNKKLKNQILRKLINILQNMISAPEDSKKI